MTFKILKKIRDVFFAVTAMAASTMAMKQNQTINSLDFNAQQLAPLQINMPPISAQEGNAYQNECYGLMMDDINTYATKYIEFITAVTQAQNADAIKNHHFFNHVIEENRLHASLQAQGVLIEDDTQKPQKLCLFYKQLVLSQVDDHLQIIKKIHDDSWKIYQHLTTGLPFNPKVFEGQFGKELLKSLEVRFNTK